MRKLILILIAFFAVVTFIRALNVTSGTPFSGIVESGIVEIGEIGEINEVESINEAESIR